MYIYNFFESLELLKDNSIPNFECFPKGKVIYYGQYKKEDLIQEGITVDIFPNAEHSNYYLAYAYVYDIYTINYINIDKFIDYIDKLNEERSLIAGGADIMKRDAAYIEAIWLFDELACLKVNPFFEADIKYGFSALSMYKHNGYDQESLLNLFDGNPIRRDIFFAQFFYFIKKYIKHRIKGKTYVTIRDFERNTLNALKEYDQQSPNHYKSYLVTQDDNKEFDDFIQQLNILDKEENKTCLKND